MNRLKEIRLAHGFRQIDLAEKLGVLQSTISHWENGMVEPDSEALIKMAGIFNTTVDHLIGGKPTKPTIYGPTPIGCIIPVLSTFKAGDSAESSENISGYIETYSSDTELAPFGLRLQDDSMAPRICAGDIVIIAQNYENFLPCDGDTMAVSVAGGNAIVRNIIRTDPHGIWLLPSNPNFNSQFYTHEDLSKLPVQFIGYVIGIRAKIDYKKR